MGMAVIIAVPILLVLVTAVLAAIVTRPIQRRWFAGTGLEQWRDTASTLPWVDRWRLYWANTLGRSAGPRLAPLAVKRGRAMAEISERITSGDNKLHRMRWLWRVLTVIGVCLIASNIYLIVSRHADAITWFQLVVWTVLTVLYASMLRLQRWQGG